MQHDPNPLHDGSGETQLTSDDLIRISQAAFRVAYMVLQDRASAEDVAQSAMEVVLVGLHIQDPKAYAVTVAYRLALKEARRRATIIHPAEIPEPAVDLTSTEADEVVARLVLEGLLSHLSPQQANVIEARYLAGMSVAQVAEMLQVSVNTVKTHLRLGFKNLIKAARETP